MGELIVHIAAGAVWQAAEATGAYVPADFVGDGFIHLSRPEQAHLPANAAFGRRTGLVLLWIDVDRLTSELRYEAVPPDGEEFPHLFGPLNAGAVVGVTPLPPWEPGSFALPACPVEM